MQDFSQFHPMDFSMWSHGPDSSLLNQLMAAKGKAATQGQPIGPGSDIGAASGAPLQAPATSSDPGTPPTPGLFPFQGPQAAPLPAPLPPKEGRLHGALHGLLTGDQPQGYSNDLTPQEIAGERPGILRSLFTREGAAGGEQWRQNLDQLVQKKRYAAAAQAAVQVKAKRQQIFDTNPIASYAPTEEGRAAWATKVIPALAAVGDYEGVKELNDWTKGANKGNVPKGELFTDPKTGKFQFFDPSKETDIPLGWEPVKTTGGGTAALFVDKNGNFDSAHPDDTAKLKELGQKGFMPVSTNNVVLKNEGMTDRFNKKQITTLQTQFKKDVNPWTTQVRAQEYAIRALETALNDPNPAKRRTTFGSALSKYIQGADQPTNLREGMVKLYESKLDPSLRGRASYYFDKLLKGEFPPAMGQAMIDHIKDLRDVNYNAINQRRDEFLSNNPFLSETDIPSTLSFFGGEAGYTGPKAPDSLIPGITPVRKP